MCDRNGIGFSMIGNDNIFHFGPWFTFLVCLDAAILMLKRAFLSAMYADMKICLLDLTRTFPGLPFCFG
jgi:hypothetical protein